jgi:hypothetical protein
VTQPRTQQCGALLLRHQRQQMLQLAGHTCGSNRRQRRTRSEAGTAAGSATCMAQMGALGPLGAPVLYLACMVGFAQHSRQIMQHDLRVLVPPLPSPLHTP